MQRRLHERLYNTILAAQMMHGVVVAPVAAGITLCCRHPIKGQRAFPHIVGLPGRLRDDGRPVT